MKNDLMKLMFAVDRNRETLILPCLSGSESPTRTCSSLNS